MGKTGLWVGFIAALAFTGACTPTQFITIKTVVPPEMDIPSNIQNVAVLEFGGHQEGSRVVSGKLEQELLNNQHYKLIERSEIAAVISEKNFQQTDLVETNPAFLEAMKIKSVQAIITGSVATFSAVTERGFDERPQQFLKERRRVGTDKRGNPIMEPVYETRIIREPWIQRSGNANATFKMVDAGTGQIISSVSKGGAYTTGKVKGDVVETDSQVLEKAALDAVIKFIKDISPWTEVRRLALKRGPNCAVGNNFAVNGLYDKAEAEFAAAAGVPGNFAAFYNLGLVLEAEGRFAEAEQAFDRALSIRPTDREIMDGINRMKTKKGFEERLRKLRGGQ